ELDGALVLLQPLAVARHRVLILVVGHPLLESLSCDSHLLSPPRGTCSDRSSSGAGAGSDYRTTRGASSFLPSCFARRPARRSIRRCYNRAPPDSGGCAQAVPMTGKGRFNTEGTEGRRREHREVLM